MTEEQGPVTGVTGRPPWSQGRPPRGRDEPPGRSPWGRSRGSQGGRRGARPATGPAAVGQRQAAGAAARGPGPLRLFRFLIYGLVLASSGAQYAVVPILPVYAHRLGLTGLQQGMVLGATGLATLAVSVLSRGPLRPVRRAQAHALGWTG